MERLTAKEDVTHGNDFYEILFASMNGKMSICLKYKDEMHMVNMVSRDVSVEVASEKTEILKKYLTSVQADSAQTLKKAVATLDFKIEENRPATIEGLHIYISAVLNKYLVQYQQNPDKFFENSNKIKAELKAYLDVMLYGICK